MRRIHGDSHAKNGTKRCFSRFARRRVYSSTLVRPTPSILSTKVPAPSIRRWPEVRCMPPIHAGIILCSKDQAGAAVKDIEKGVPIPTSAKGKYSASLPSLMKDSTDPSADSFAIPPSGGSAESFHKAASPSLLRDVCISSADAISPSAYLSYLYLRFAL